MSDDNLPDPRIAEHARSPFKFILLVFVLTIPFWLIGFLTEVELLPGLPVSAFAVVCPLLAALILVYRKSKMAGIAALLKRSFDFKRIKAKGWYIPVLLLMPVLSGISFGIQRLTGMPVPNPQFALISTLTLCIVFFVSALSEELGWSGYAIDPMQNRWGAFRASLILGVAWAVWHYVSLAQAYRSVEWIAWWSLGTVANRVILVWLYNNTGKSVFATALFHMMINLSWQLFPINGSYFDPRVSGILSTIVVIVIVVIWDSRTLTRYRTI